MATPRLTRDDWAAAALAALETSGVRAVAVERLAKQLGTTKGSFYWHFTDRAELVGAALERWAEETEALAAGALAAAGSPQDRLEELLRSAFASASAGLDGPLLADVDEPAVAAAVARVTARRLEILRQLYAEAGSVDPDADARYAYTAFIGLIALRRAAPRSVPDVEAHVAGLMRRLQPAT